MHERWRKITKFRLGSCGGTWGAAGDREKVKIGAGWMTGAVGDRGTLKGTTKRHERWRKGTKVRLGSRGGHDGGLRVTGETLKGNHEGHERWRKVTKVRQGSRKFSFWWQGSRGKGLWGPRKGTKIYEKTRNLGWGAAGDREKVKIGAGWMTGAVGDRGTLKGTTKRHERWRKGTKVRLGSRGWNDGGLWVAGEL